MTHAIVFLAGLLLSLPLVACNRNATQSALSKVAAPPDSADSATQPAEADIQAAWPCSQGDHIAGVRLSPDGHQLWVGRTSGKGTSEIIAWDLKSGRAGRLAGGRVPIPWVPEASADGKRLAALGSGGHSSPSDPYLECWDAVAGRRIFQVPVSGRKGDLASMALSADGRLIAAGGFFNWSVSESVNPGPGLLPSRYDHALFVWDVDSGRELLHVKLGGTKQHISGLAFSPDGKWLATASTDGLRIWDVAKLELVKTIKGMQADRLRFSGDGSRLVASAEGGAWLLDTADWKPILPTARLTWPAVSDKTGDTLIAAEYSDTVIGRRTGRVIVYDVKSQRNKREIATPLSQVWSLDLSPDGQTIVAASREDIRLFSVAAGEEIRAPMPRRP